MVKDYDFRDPTGGSYMQIPVNNSIAVKRVMHWPHASMSSQVQHREPYAPFGTDYNRPPKQPRVSSAVLPRRNVVGPLNPHRPSSATFSPQRPTESRVSRNAPYQARLNDSMFYTTPSGVPNSVPLPSYDALNDPHLSEYFIKKFSHINSTSPYPPRGSGRPGSASKSGKHGKFGKDGKEGAVYKVAVTTGDRKGGGTDAKVYLRLLGSKGKLPKKQLLKKSNKTQKKKKTRFKFNRGTTHVFKFEAKDIGELTSITLEHDGLTKDESWFVEQVVITKHIIKTGKEKCWTFTCHQWLSLHVGDCQISRELYPKVSSKTGK